MHKSRGREIGNHRFIVSMNTIKYREIGLDSGNDYDYKHKKLESIGFQILAPI
tara:strand:- start:434 stop:592 length:159 start_codon:yes stop_codon:yes gene_type:complete